MEKEIITPNEFADRMKKIHAFAIECDKESAHGQADELMCIILESLGYKEGVKIFNDMPKWYA